ncbi:dehydrin DHN1 [Cicer arietinum]|uniref:Dehydrin DHN3 n=2 Tax=Cicer arietinum TaxID=3827 RepID=A0A1S2Z0P8_CICAR|nr:dehydrin DHN3 [Cicer arietinum]
MSYNQGQYVDQTRRTDEYGNPIVQVDQYGNPINQSGVGMTGEAGRTFENPGLTGHHEPHKHGDNSKSHTTSYGTHTGSGGGTGDDYGTHNTRGGGGMTGAVGKIFGTTDDTGNHHGVDQTTTDYGTHNPGSYGTNPGSYGTNTGGYGNTNTGSGYGTKVGQEFGREEAHHHGGEQKHGEKKGIMDKIKEKLPGTGH